jgi:hypothetical protein
MSFIRAFFVALAAFGAALGALGQPASAPMAGGMHHGHSARGPGDCAGTALKCASAVTPFFDGRGTLWIAWAAGGAVSVAKSADAGKSFSPATVIGTHGAMLDVGADARPQIAVDAEGRVVVAYGVFKDKQYNAQIMVSTSADGIAFSAPRPLSKESPSERFPVLGVANDGAIFAAWLDKRTVAAAKKKGVDQPGAALAYAWSHDGGASFGPERIAEDHTCECCRLALAFDQANHPVALFRSIYGKNDRDHSVLTFSADGTPGPAYRVAADRWEIDGCPHHGPSVAVATDGSYQAAWFTLGQARQGLFYARSTDAGKTFSAPQAVGDASAQAGRPQLLARGNTVWMAWKEFDGKQVFIKERHSPDSGLHWSADRIVGTTTSYADHPLLAADRQHVYLSWMTRLEGYRIIPMEQP